MVTHSSRRSSTGKDPSSEGQRDRKKLDYHEGMSSQENESQVKSPKVHKPRGFAAMSPEKQRELSRRGGEAAHRKGVAHRFTAADAREAGRKGGRATHAKRKAEQIQSSQSSGE